eukprot:gb/GECH01010732.1/.p1 GENE.gb/GECH01010732.1/~~gb/GECH01010732.1/.p1  ORF type:complete len:1506 (+),score=365.01 gb/GECH01010732.1/:1-4518(+)
MKLSSVVTCLLIISLCFSFVENLQVETRCEGVQGSYTFEINTHNEEICIPGNTPDSGDCSQRQVFYVPQDGRFVAEASEPLTCYYIHADGPIEEYEIVPPHMKEQQVRGSMWLASGKVYLTTYSSGWTFQINGEEVPSNVAENSGSFTYTINGGSEILNNSLYGIVELCSGTAEQNVSPFIDKEGGYVGREDKIALCKDGPVLDGMEYREFNQIEKLEPKPLTECTPNLPIAECPGGGMQLIYNGEVLSEFEREYYVSIRLRRTPENILCPGFVYANQTLELRVGSWRLQESVIEFCSYPPGHPERKRCTDRFEKSFSDVYSVDFEIELNEEFSTEIEVILETSSCAPFSATTRIQYLKPSLELQFAKFPIDDEKALHVVSTTSSAHIMVKKGKETLLEIENGNTGIVLANRSEIVWAQAHSEFCREYSVWETAFEQNILFYVSRLYLPSRGMYWWHRGVDRNTREYLESRLTPEASAFRLKSNTEYTLDYLSGNQSFSLSFTTNPVVPQGPDVSWELNENGCDLHLSLSALQYCQVGMSEDRVTAEQIEYTPTSYGKNYHKTPVMKCGDNLYKWKIPIPPKYSYDPEQMEVQVTKDPSKCFARFRIENVDWNPWEELSLKISEFNSENFNRDLEAHVHLDSLQRNLSIWNDSCVGEPKAVKEIQMPDHFFPEWVDKDIPVSYEWIEECSKIQFNVTWDDGFYINNPDFVVLELNLKDDTGDTFFLTETAEAGKIALDFFPEQFVSPINYRMDVSNCSDQRSLNIGWPWQQIEIESCDQSEPGESIPENIPDPPPPVTRERPGSRPVRRFWGDPHLQTIDGNDYSFNGIGEYVLIRSQNTSKDNDDEPFFHIQVSLTSANQGSFKGSTISGVALQLDETVVEYNDQQEIYTNGELNNNVTMNSTVSINGSPLTVSRYIDSDGNNVVDMEVLESSNVQPYETFLFRCVLSGGTISFAYSLPDYIFKNSEGLGGYWDGDDTNDFQLSNGTVFHGNLTEREAFHFGISWALSIIPDHPSSLFHSPSTEDPESYTPDFIEELDTKDISQDKKDACAQYSDPIEYKRCLFDVEATNNLEMANVGKQMEKVEEETKKQQVKIPQSLEGIFATNITETSAFISWNNLRGKYRVAPYYTEKIKIHLEPFDNDDAPVIQRTTPFDTNGIQVTLVSGTEYLLTAKLINEVGTSSSTPIRHFTTISPPQPDSSSISSSTMSSSGDEDISSSSSSFESMSKDESSSSTENESSSEILSSSTNDNNNGDSSSSSISGSSINSISSSSNTDESSSSSYYPDLSSSSSSSSSSENVEKSSSSNMNEKFSSSSSQIGSGSSSSSSSSSISSSFTPNESSSSSSSIISSSDEHHSSISSWNSNSMSDKASSSSTDDNSKSSDSNDFSVSSSSSSSNENPESSSSSVDNYESSSSSSPSSRSSSSSSSGSNMKHEVSSSSSSFDSSSRNNTSSESDDDDDDEESSDIDEYDDTMSLASPVSKPLTLLFVSIINLFVNILMQLD